MKKSTKETGENLKNTLAQARKRIEELEHGAQVETALEKVRARAMAMRHSDELADASSVVFEQLKYLGISPKRCGFTILGDANKTLDVWGAVSYKEGMATYKFGILSADLHPLFTQGLSDWQAGKPGFLFTLEGQLLKEYHESVFSLANFPASTTSEVLAETSVEYHYNASFKYGTIAAIFHDLPSESVQRLLQRFARVFEQTYTRFLDLQQAEAQTREALIEAALERVRAKAMAMHSSEDLTATVSIVFQEMQRLNVTSMRCGIGLIDRITRIAEAFVTGATNMDKALELVNTVKLEGHPVLENIFDHWKQQEEYHPILQGKSLKSYYQQLQPHLAIPVWQSDVVQYGYYFPFPEGVLYAWTESPLNETELHIFRKFSAVLALTYRRYMDLKEAEMRAREAVRQASLDRVRAEIASMRTAEDLQRITPLIWRELTSLGVPFFRCGVFIVDPSGELVHAYLSTPSGESLAALHLKFGSMPLVEKIVNHWQEQENYRAEWQRKEFEEWTTAMLQQGFIDNPTQYQAGDEAPEKLVLQFVPFNQGMLYVGSAMPLSTDHLNLAQSLAEAFAVAYARYEDFTKLEAAKKNVEDALTELKAAQTQLIHNEKMASLGQMTAGIAHEIKNPLNFVNNFAVLSEELAEELAEAIESGEEDINEILADLKQNAAAIAKHGRRADAIVKSMMQHARGGSGERESTNINNLVEEYVNLAFHGKRAAKPGFGVEIERDYDESLKEIVVKAQEIGRVLLNLLNNAFDAVEEKFSRANSADKPIVKVTTSLNENYLEIRISDNGCGIPEEIKEKIFEPFFTTKPTGAGTGLGLSLSYDIITQGHGGMLSVISKAGEGTTLIVKLPSSKT